MSLQIINKIIEEFLHTAYPSDLQDEVRKAVGYIKEELPDEDAGGNFFVDTWFEDKDGNEMSFYPIWNTRDAITLLREIDPEYLDKKRHQPIFNVINILICLIYLEWKDK